MAHIAQWRKSLIDTGGSFLLKLLFRNGMNEWRMTVLSL
jgi:hypothetical protein